MRNLKTCPTIAIAIVIALISTTVLAKPGGRQRGAEWGEQDRSRGDRRGGGRPSGELVGVNLVIEEKDDVYFEFRNVDQIYDKCVRKLDQQVKRWSFIDEVKVSLRGDSRRLYKSLGYYGSSDEVCKKVQATVMAKVAKQQLRPLGAATIVVEGEVQLDSSIETKEYAFWGSSIPEVMQSCRDSYQGDLARSVIASLNDSETQKLDVGFGSNKKPFCQVIRQFLRERRREDPSGCEYNGKQYEFGDTFKDIIETNRMPRSCGGNEQGQLIEIVESYVPKKCTVRDGIINNGSPVYNEVVRIEGQCRSRPKDCYGENGEVVKAGEVYHFRVGGPRGIVRPDECQRRGSKQHEQNPLHVREYSTEIKRCDGRNGTFGASEGTGPNVYQRNADGSLTYYGQCGGSLTVTPPPAPATPPAPTPPAPTPKPSGCKKTYAGYGRILSEADKQSFERNGIFFQELPTADYSHTVNVSCRQMGLEGHQMQFICHPGGWRVLESASTCSVNQGRR